MHVSNITNTRMQEENDSKNTLMNDIVACKTRTVIYLFIYLFIFSVDWEKSCKGSHGEKSSRCLLEITQHLFPLKITHKLHCDKHDNKAHVGNQDSFNLEFRHTSLEMAKS